MPSISTDASPFSASTPPDVYAPSGYEPVSSKLTYGPAKAAPANRNGDAATAAIVDLIIFLKVSRKGTKKPCGWQHSRHECCTFYAGARSFDPFVLCNVI